MIYTLTLNPAVDRELTVPELAYDTVLRAGESRIDIGGKGFNISRLLHQLGAASTAVGFLGGRAGALLQDGLQALGIATDFVWVAGETRTNISIVSPAQGHYIKVNEKGPPVAPEKQHELLEKIKTLTHPGDWWVMAGSLPPGISDDFYARIIQIVNRRGAQAILDTSGEALRLGCAASPSLVKPNREEAQALTGYTLAAAHRLVSDAAAAAAEIRGLGAHNVIISLGKEGAFLQTAQGGWLARTPAVQELNPIGAGDALVGGFVWALTQGYSMKEALGWGVSSGAATAGLSGTAVGSRRLIETLQLQVKVEQISSPANE